MNRIPLLLELPAGADQVLVEGKKCWPLMRSISGVERVSVNETGEWILGLYWRDNPNGRYEYGIFLSAGPNSEESAEVGDEMLRIFLRDKERCKEVAESLYNDLVAEHELRPMMIARNLRSI
jgi:hypothetical protein